MESLVVIRGAFINKAFVPEEPLPEIEGRAELIVHAQMPMRLSVRRSTKCSAKRSGCDPRRTLMRSLKKSELLGTTHDLRRLRYRYALG